MINFKNKQNKLSITEAKYWRKVFNSNLMIGTEIEQMFKKSSIDTTDVRRMLSPLNIGSSPEEFRSPVETVKSDGSLRGGAEIITPGRRVYGFMEQFSMYQSIYSCLKDNDPIISPRCGWHNHIVLQDMGAKALERPDIPKIIFDNFMLLVQHYYPALAFMSATIPDEDCYTRYSYFNLTEALKNYNAEYTLRHNIHTFHERYNAVNLNPIRVDSDDKLLNFHVEFRFPDGTLFPVQMASLNILFKALVIKAIELSKFGVVDFEEDTTELYRFKNNGYGRDTSNDDYDEDDDDYDDDEDDDNDYDYDYDDGTFLNTFSSDERQSAMVTEEIIDCIKELAKEMVNLLEPEIIAIDSLALPFIKHLAVKPITIMFKELGTDDLRIVNDRLEEMLDENYKKIDEDVLPLLEVIELGVVRDTETEEEWFDKASGFVSYKEPMEDLIKKISGIMDLGFNKDLGFYFK